MPDAMALLMRSAPLSTEAEALTDMRIEAWKTHLPSPPKHVGCAGLNRFDAADRLFQIIVGNLMV